MQAARRPHQRGRARTIAPTRAEHVKYGHMSDCDDGRDDELHALLAQLDSTDEKALLVTESIELLRELENAFFRPIVLKRGAGAEMSLLDSVPELALTLFPLFGRGAWSVADIPWILNAFARLACHSQRLNVCPELKTAFWLRVLQSKMTHEDTRDVPKSAFRRPDFPAFVVDFSGSCLGDRRGITPNDETRGSFTLNDAVGDALVAFMTSPPSGSTSMSVPSEQNHTRRRLAFGFRFEKSKLMAPALEVIERFLDRTFASADRQFDVNMLSFRLNPMVASDLAVLTRIVRKSTHVYGVEELLLDEVMPESGGYACPDWQPPKSTPKEYMTLARVVFDIEMLPPLESRKLLPSAALLPGANVKKSRLCKVSMSGNHVCTELFAMRFSALRYGCALTSDMTGYMAKPSSMREDSLDYWRWVAFGLFYPRPRRFAARSKLRDIGLVAHNPDSVETLMRTLRNPASELVYNGKNEHGGDDVVKTTELMVCVVTAGASVEVFKTGSVSKPGWTDTLTQQSELEAICETSDGSVYVVVPGVGLGWVRAEFVMRIEREPLSTDRSENDGLYDVSMSVHSDQWGRRWDNRWENSELKRSMLTLIKTVGRQFHSLRFRDSDYFEPGFLQSLLESCSNLERLSLLNRSLSVEDGDVLLDALSGPLRGRLLSLNVRNNNKLQYPFRTRLYAILSDTTNLPALREVRLNSRDFYAEDYAALYALFEVNRTLAVVEYLNNDRAAYFRNAGRQLNDAFGGELLQSALSYASKLAFLSVVASTSDRTPSAVRLLSADVLASIFAFAPSREVRRMIAMEEEIKRKV